MERWVHGRHQVAGGRALSDPGRLLEDLCDEDTNARQVRSDLLAQVMEALEAHARIEIEIFHPAFASLADPRDDIRLVQDAFEESHVVIDLLLPRLQDVDITSNPFGARTKVLGQLSSTTSGKGRPSRSRASRS